MSDDERFAQWLRETAELAGSVRQAILMELSCAARLGHERLRPVEALEQQAYWIEEGEYGPVFEVAEGLPARPWELEQVARLARASIHPSASEAVRTSLEQLGRWREVATEVFPRGSWGDAYARGLADRLALPSGDATLVCSRLVRTGADARGVGPHEGIVVVEFRGDGVRRRVALQRRGLSDVQAWPFDRARLLALLQRAVDAESADLHWLLEPPLPTIPPASFAAWTLSELPGLIADADGIVVSMDVGGGSASVRLLGPPQRDPGTALRWSFRLEHPAYTTEQEVYWGRLGVEDFERPAPSGGQEELVQRACRAWTEALARCWLDATGGSSRPLMPHDLVYDLPYVGSVVATWLDDGPPSAERPTRIVTTPTRLEALASSLRTSVREVGSTQLVEMTLEPWSIRIRREEDGGSAAWSLELAAHDGAFVRVAENDPCSAAELFAPIGDNDLFRSFATLLRDAVMLAGPSTDVTVDDGGQPLPLSELLRFGDRTRGAPRLDRRLEFDFAFDEDPREARLRVVDDPDAPASEQRQRAVYIACIQDLFDPEFEVEGPD